jgi:hypothetical protein
VLQALTQCPPASDFSALAVRFKTTATKMAKNRIADFFDTVSPRSEN